MRKGEHLVRFYEEAEPAIMVEKLMSETDALEAVGLWLILESPSERWTPPGVGNSPDAVNETLARLIALMGEDIKGFLP